MRYTEKCEHCKHWIGYDASRFECACALSGFNCAFEGRDGWRPKTYTELEKENAELKERVDNLYNSDCWASEQLTKAKELIELLLSDNRTMKAQFESEEQANMWFEHIHQAEQFLNSEVQNDSSCKNKRNR